MSESLSIVIPAYNEEKRIPRTLEHLANEISLLARGGLDVVEVIVVDDGSEDHTGKVTEKFKSRLPELRILKFEKNRGKGAAVKSGCLAAGATWILIADADMSTPWLEALVLRNKIGEGTMAMASRGLSDSRISKRQPWIREHMGRIFNFILRFFAQVPFRDTQCGFKLLRREQALPILQKLSIQRFAWDVELVILLLRSDRAVREVATTWEHRDESRVHMIRDSSNMLWTIVVLKIKLFFRD